MSKIYNYKGTNLSYDMLCEHISSNNKDKERDKLYGNFLVDLQNLTTKIENILVCQKCAHE